MRTNFEEVAIGEIHFEPLEPHRADITKLADSIAYDGLKEHPLVEPDPDKGGYRVISGRRRMAAIRHLYAKDRPVWCDGTKRFWNARGYYRRVIVEIVVDWADTNEAPSGDVPDAQEW